MFHAYIAHKDSVYLNFFLQTSILGGVASLNGSFSLCEGPGFIRISGASFISKLLNVNIFLTYDLEAVYSLGLSTLRSVGAMEISVACNG